MRRAILLGILGLGLFLGATPAAAHVHKTEKNPHHDQELANGQNHPGFNVVDGLLVSCEGTDEPEDIGPAGYGLETAHHGPDQGTPGNADGCYAGFSSTGGSRPDDTNPGIK